MTRQEAIETSLWACTISGRPSVKKNIMNLTGLAESGEGTWADLSEYLIKTFPENPSLADGVFNG